MTPQKLKYDSLKYNIYKSFIEKADMEYLRLWVTLNGICLIKTKVESIVNITPLKNKKQVRAFISLANYYRDMQARWPHLIQPLTIFQSEKGTFKWKNVEQKEFDDIKHVVDHNTLLAYPYFNK